MTPSEAVKTVLSKYVDFGGRARRSEYWYWALAVVVAEIIVLGIKAVAEGPGRILYILLVLGVLLPSFAVAVRRLHDTGRSGWWILIGLVPVVGWIILIVFYVQDSAPGTNDYGPSPKGGDAPAAPTV
jgi:uncharacterized membrane protein YhaH (DUF805 family)